MTEPSRNRATTARSGDPLGLELKSIPEPLQRWWLIGQGNPYFQADARRSRYSLGIPLTGFSAEPDYREWLATRRKMHGHDQPWPFYINIDGRILDDDESLIRYRDADIGWPEELGAPAPCCAHDPLYSAARSLASRYGIDAVEGEPGFQGVEEDVIGFLLVGTWPQRRSYRGSETIYETDVLVDPSSGKRFRERYRRVEMGMKSRGGQGHMLREWHRWWKQHREGIPIATITDSTDPVLEERAVRHGIAEVERLMRPLQI